LVGALLHRASSAYSILSCERMLLPGVVTLQFGEMDDSATSRALF
jgi:hypothetical protein